MADNVQHPKHYNRKNAMECIDEMILVFGEEAVKNFCLCNAWKYRYRAADKNGEEDLKKSDWYIKKYKELCGAPVTIKTVEVPYPVITPCKETWTINDFPPADDTEIVTTDRTVSINKVSNLD